MSGLSIATPSIISPSPRIWDKKHQNVFPTGNVKGTAAQANNSKYGVLHAKVFPRAEGTSQQVTYYTLLRVNRLDIWEQPMLGGSLRQPQTEPRIIRCNVYVSRSRRFSQRLCYRSVAALLRPRCGNQARRRRIHSTRPSASAATCHWATPRMTQPSVPTKS